MQTNHHHARDFGYLLLAWAALFGAFLRVYPVAVAGFPVNDGGLFYRFVQEIQANQFALPHYSSFNQMGLPFTYPPLAFYLTAALQSLTHMPLIELIRWLPPLFSWLQIFAFYGLARALAPDDALLSSLAALIFALLPRVYQWDIMGGGLTRALGGLLALLLLGQIIPLLHTPSPRRFAAVVGLGSLVLLTHPERSLHAGVAILVLWWFLGRTRLNFLRLLAAGVGVLLLTAPWWLTVLRLHGLEPYRLAFGIGGHRGLFWLPLLYLNFSEETIPIIMILAVIGVMASLVTRRGLLPVWILAAFLLDPRNAPPNLGAPLALLAATAWLKVILPGLARLRSTTNPADFLFDSLGRWLQGYLMIMLVLSAAVQSFDLSNLHVTVAERAGYQWVSQNTPPASRFVLITWQPKPMLSPVIEWFPALTERINLTTVQGREWLAADGNYQDWKALAEALQSCVWRDAACLETKAAALDQSFEYVWLSLGAGEQASALSQALAQAPTYAPVFDNGEVRIYQRMPGPP